MALKVLIVPDKFKGTLTAEQAAEAIARGWRRKRPDDALDLLPMSDGGDGFGEILSRQLGAQPQSIETVDAAHRRCQSVWWWHAPSRTAIVESARLIGLAMLPRGQFHPFDLDTFGVGAVLDAAASHGAQRCLVGVGGSATNDGGFGLAKALGWQFLDARGAGISAWTKLHALDRLHQPASQRLFDDLTVAVDVQNPLLGPAGCTRVYGPQKGIRPEDIELTERCLGQLAGVAHRHFQQDIAAEPGAGAAGGLGFGFRCFAGAQLEPGFALFSRLACLEDRVKSCQLVITGEGAIDRSTLMGKGVGELARLCRELKVPCVGVGGGVSEAAQRSQAFAALYALAPELTTTEAALAEPARWLEDLTARIAETCRNRVLD
jgi:glycerate kinase